MITFEFTLLIGAIVLLIFTVIALLKHSDKSTLIKGCLFIIYLTIVATITLFPIVYEEKFEFFGTTTWYNLTPFKTIAEIFSNVFNLSVYIQVFGNICMVVPYGIFIMMFIKKNSWQKALFFAVLFTVTIELTQMFIGLLIGNMYRVTDIDDIILNVIGCYIGYSIYKLLPVDIKKRVPRTQFV